MGTSFDYEAAVEEATFVRVGTALVGVENIKRRLYEF